MTELEKLKKMLVSAHDELRVRKQKNTPTFGAMMFMLQAIVQCNAALNERYTLAQILAAWTASYGEDMNEEYPGFIQRLSEEKNEKNKA